MNTNVGRTLYYIKTHKSFKASFNIYEDKYWRSLIILFLPFDFKLINATMENILD